MREAGIALRGRIREAMKLANKHEENYSIDHLSAASRSTKISINIEIYTVVSESDMEGRHGGEIFTESIARSKLDAFQEKANMPSSMGQFRKQVRDKIQSDLPKWLRDQKSFEIVKNFETVYWSNQCTRCKGKGRLTCKDCGGTGYAQKQIVCSFCSGSGKSMGPGPSCSACGGDGRNPCPRCNGSTRAPVLDGYRIDSYVPCGCMGGRVGTCLACMGTGAGAPSNSECPRCGGSGHCGYRRENCSACSASGTCRCEQCAGCGEKFHRGDVSIRALPTLRNFQITGADQLSKFDISQHNVVEDPLFRPRIDHMDETVNSIIINVSGVYALAKATVHIEKNTISVFSSGSDARSIRTEPFYLLDAYITNFINFALEEDFYSQRWNNSLNQSLILREMFEYIKKFSATNRVSDYSMKNLSNYQSSLKYNQLLYCKPPFLSQEPAVFLLQMYNSYNDRLILKMLDPGIGSANWNQIIDGQPIAKRLIAHISPQKGTHASAPDISPYVVEMVREHISSFIAHTSRSSCRIGLKHLCINVIVFYILSISGFLIFHLQQISRRDLQFNIEEFIIFYAVPAFASFLGSRLIADYTIDRTVNKRNMTLNTQHVYDNSTKWRRPLLISKNILSLSGAAVMMAIGMMVSGRKIF